MHLSSSRLDHKVACECADRRRFERTNDDALVERVAGHDLPVIEDRDAEGLRAVGVGGRGFRERRGGR
jgi:hypothetical protein